MEWLSILSAGITGILLGRILMKRWYNHLTLYSFLWTLCLALYKLRFIQYYRILPEAWFYIGLSWFMLYLGSIAVIFAQMSTHQPSHSSEMGEVVKPYLSTNLKFLSRTIVILCILSFVAIIYQFVTAVQTFGSIGAAIIQAHALYSMRIEGEIGTIPYLGSLPIAACCMAGIYTALCRKITFLSLLPFISISIYGILTMGRTIILIAFALFVTALFYTPHKRFVSHKTIMGLILAVVLAIGAFTLISSVRTLVVHFKSETKEMKVLRSRLLFLPSLYFYLSSPPVAFSEYLYLGGEKFPPGSYTFKPIFNILAKVGLADRPPPYNKFIRTPELINAGTYLREIHAEFGPLGVMIFPYLLGIILTSLCVRVSRRPTITWIVILAHFFVIIWASWDINTTKLGAWAVSLLVSLLIALKLDSMAKER